VGYGKISLFRNLSFTLQNPGFLAIVGHNGSGKSSFFKAFLQQIPYQGEIFFNGVNLRTVKKSSPLFKEIGFLGQKNAINFEISVRELMVMGRFKHKGFLDNYSDEDYQKVFDIAKEFDLSVLLDQDFNSLSGGEQQLVWLSQLALQDTPVFCLDEPTQQLDVYNKKRVFSILNNWVANDGKLVICITHDINNLEVVNGSIINFSEAQPEIEPIGHDSIQRHLAFLEKEKNLSSHS